MGGKVIDQSIADHWARLLKLYLPDAVIRFDGKEFRVRDQAQHAIATWILFCEQDPKMTTTERELPQ